MKMSRLSVSLAALALCACGETGITDDFTRDGRAPAYVPGAETVMHARSERAVNADDWRFTSSDSSVFRVEDKTGFCLFACGSKSARFFAVGLGTAELEVVTRSGRPVTSATIEVVVPTAASIVAGEDIVVESDLERDELEALERAERVEGLVRIALPEGLEGEAEPTVFALELTRDGARVAGIGELLARSSGGAANAVVEGSTRLSGRPWLSLEPREIGRTTVTVEVAAERFVEFEVEVVSAESVRSIEIVGRPGRAVGAVARDAEGRRVFGVAPEWSVDGQRVGQGHRVPLVEEAGQRLLRVCLSEDVCDELVLPNLTPTLAFDGNDLPPAPVSSCAQASGAAPMFGLLFVGLALLRRRRR